MDVALGGFNLYSTLKLIVIFIFFIQIVAAVQVFRKRRSHLSRSVNGSPVIIVLNQATSTSQQVPNDGVGSTIPNQMMQRIISTQNHRSNRGGPKRVQKSLILGSVFLLTFLFISHVLRPITFAWIPILFPILMVLPFLVFPSYFNLKTFPTLLNLIFGIGLGGFSLFLIL